MTAERDSMTLNEVSVPALGVEERSDEAPRAGRARPTPDPEVVAKPKRRQFTAEYRLRVLEEADRCTQPGEVGRLLRREGLYSSHLTAWRKARRKGSLRELAAKKRGAKPAERNPLDAKVRALEAQVARLEHELYTAQRTFGSKYRDIGKSFFLPHFGIEPGTRIRATVRSPAATATGAGSNMSQDHAHRGPYQGVSSPARRLTFSATANSGASASGCCPRAANASSSIASIGESAVWKIVSDAASDGCPRCARSRATAMRRPCDPAEVEAMLSCETAEGLIRGLSLETVFRTSRSGSWKSGTQLREPMLPAQSARACRSLPGAGSLDIGQGRRTGTGSPR